MLLIKYLDKKGNVATIEGEPLVPFYGFDYWNFAISHEASGLYAVNEITSGLFAARAYTVDEAIKAARLTLATKSQDEIEAARALVAKHVAEIAFQEALALAASL